MKTPSISKAINWIAMNDGNGDRDRLDPKHVAWLMTSVMVADLFGLTPQDVGRRVVEQRISNDEFEKLRGRK